MPGPYHTVIGNEITVYLNLIWSGDGDFPTDNILAEIARVWVPMAAAHGKTISVALAWDTSPPPLAPPPAGLTVSSAIAPAGVEFFNLEIGRGATANPATRASRTSYVSYDGGTGYIYHRDEAAAQSFVPAISHELGHVLGLTDRYYEAMYWLLNVRMDRTCAQIRDRIYVESGVDYRLGVLDSPPTVRPRLAVRASLPMSNEMVVDLNGNPVDPDYDPYHNLMSTSSPTLSQYQMNVITTGTRERLYRSKNWVAVLGDWRRYPLNGPSPPTPPTGAFAAGRDSPDNIADLTQWLFPAWEARPQDGGSGLLFRPFPNGGPQRYPAVRIGRRARNKNDHVLNSTRLAIVLGKKRVSLFGGSTYNVSGITSFPETMCHVRQLLFDLQRND